jgi:ribosomal protein S18 acetylase RimI-like enzyme
MGFELRDATDEDTPSVAELAREADDARVISVESLQHQRRTRPERARMRDLVAEDDDGRVVAAGAAGIDIWASPDTGWASLTVTADRRRQGIGSALGDALLEHLRSIGVTRVTTFTRHTDESERWVTARGWARALAGPLIAVDPRRVPEPELPDGFRCVALAELTPEAVFPAVYEATMDEPSAVPRESFPMDEFVREWDDPDLDLASSAATVHGDRVVAFSFIKTAGDRGQHGFTGTARDYRGRGFATAAKRHALRAAAARGVTRVTTSNAEENAAMRAINRRLGFEAIGEHVIYSRTLP